MYRLTVSMASLAFFGLLAFGSASDEATEVGATAPAPAAPGEAPAAPGEATVDALLAGWEDGCRLSPEARTFWDSLGDASGPGAAVRAPGALASAFGAPSIESQTDEYLVLQVEGRGVNWQGFPVRYAVRTFGKSNGINAYALNLDASPMDVIPKVESSLTIRPSCVDGAPDCVAPAKMTFDSSKEGGTLVVCDVSM